MALRAKYQQLIDAANNSGVSDLQVREQNNVMYIDGNAPSEQVKNQLWDIYNQIDPDYRSGDLVLNINAIGSSAHAAHDSMQEYTVVKGDSLSKIGQKYGVSWKQIFELNKDQIKNPDLIQPGWKLKIPAAQK
ncbi:MAG TPA: LysM peptidoglycan-binding domain-containing protein [Chitinophagaceae bacterium]|jgi:nucleoid-associated protein YgaU|nr:LysM peptidoglycan-binding domain-containing protein [Chitinophagaceae bacterium]